MEKRFAFFYLIGLGVFLGIGVLIFLSNIGEGDYYRSQESFNHLPDINAQVQAVQVPPIPQELPPAIQHYQQSVDNANQQTEQSALAINGNSSSVPCIICLYHEDGSLNFMFITFLLLTFYICFRRV